MRERGTLAALGQREFRLFGYGVSKEVKNRVSIQQMHLMLTVKLQDLMEALQKLTAPRHFMLFLSGRRPVLRTLQADAIQSGKPLRARRGR